MRQHGKVDGNHAEIVAILRQAGYSVQSLAPMGDGCPDLLIGCGGNVLIEVKTPGGELTPLEYKWHHRWRGQVDVAYSIEDALRIVELRRTR